MGPRLKAVQIAVQWGPSRVNLQSREFRKRSCKGQERKKEPVGAEADVGHDSSEDGRSSKEVLGDQKSDLF